MVGAMQDCRSDSATTEGAKRLLGLLPRSSL